MHSRHRRFTFIVAACAAVLLTGVLLLNGCGGGGGDGTGITRISATELAAMMSDGEPLTVIDIRSPMEYAAACIPGSINLPLASLGTWAGTLDKTRRVCLVCACSGLGISYEAATELSARGFEQVYDLRGGLQTWPGLLPNDSSVHDVDGAALQALMVDGQPLLIIDVRTPEEYATGHIPGSINHPIAELDTWAGTLDPAARICCVCKFGGRSRTAAAMLVGKGFESVYNLLGGMDQWAGPVE